MCDKLKIAAYQVSIALIENPKIWRVIIIPQNYMVSDLHISIQCAMGWSNMHMYEFKMFGVDNNKKTVIGIPDDEYPSTEGFLDSRTTKISDVFGANTRNARYLYDFSDYWEHYLEIKKIRIESQFALLPICRGGNGVCPPEDIGGMDGCKYQNKLGQNIFSNEATRSTVVDKKHQEHRNNFIKEDVSFWQIPNSKAILHPQECELWLRKLIQGDIEKDDVVNNLCSTIPVQDIKKLYEIILTKPLRYRNKATVILGYAYGISTSFISEYLFIPKTTIHDLIKRCRKIGFIQAIYYRKMEAKHEKQEYIDKVFSILHAPPSSYGFNRTSWRQVDIRKVMSDEGIGISKVGLRKILKNSGYSYRKAKTVLTSTDPDYKEKLAEITKILSGLKGNEKFFSIDEYGPFAIKMQGGKSLVPAGIYKSVPQWQKSKGSLILTAALELSTNQITHFYSENKNTVEMIKLLNLLIKEYSQEKIIYFSWDAASWHASKALYIAVDEINRPEYREKHKCPEIILAPLPTSAQFLNVIESVFSGMARAIIHNSNYQSVDECKEAIDRYYNERNAYFLKNPRKAGNKIWGKERVKVSFSESNNCKDPKYR